MNFRNMADLSADVTQWIPQLPGRFDCIAGVPRSGLLVANMLALKLGIPVTDIHSLREGRLLGTGRRYAHIDQSTFFETPRRILVVDDSISSGESIAEARELIADVTAQHDVIFGAVYISKGKEQSCDTFYEVLPAPRFFEWNIIGNHGMMRQFCFDLDGVFCVDPTEEENDDGERYRNFLLKAQPLYVPHGRIGWIVTSRLEKFRTETEQWLQEQGIEYDRLCMLDLPSKQARIQQGATIPYKSKFYQQSGFDLFVESDVRQASGIAKETGKYVYCTENSALYGPEGAKGVWMDQRIHFKRKLRRRVQQIKRLPQRVVRKLKTSSSS